MKRMFSFLKPYRAAAFLALVLMFVELGVELIQPLLIARIINDGIMVREMQPVIYWGSILTGLALFAFAGGIVNSFAASHVSQSFGFDIREKLFRKVQAFSFANLTKFPTSSLITRMTADVTVLQNTVFMGLRIMFRAPLLVVGGAVMAFTVNFRLSLILLIAVPVLVLFLAWIMNMAGKLFKQVQERLDNVNGVMRENLVGMRLIKAFLRRGYEKARFNGANEELQQRTAASLRLVETAQPILLLFMNISILVILWLGNKQVAAAEINVGEVVAIVNYATRMTASFSVFSWLIMSISRAQASAARVNEVLDTEIDLLDQDEAVPALAIRKGEVEFDHVSFRYPGGDFPVLNEVSFTAPAGRTLAVMGATGAGKISLFQLIPRLFDTDGGEIRIDGRKIKDWKLEDLRGQIGYVPQEALLFSGTIEANIRWGKESASREEVIQAAEDAQIHETIMALPKQYDTPLGQKGINLSGGQKQRISIARALIRKPKILLLDDSTSALDVTTEAKLLEALKKYTCTTLIITQKISTAAEADSVLLLEDGCVIAEGSHEQLAGSHPLYKRIIESQAGREGSGHEKIREIR